MGRPERSKAAADSGPWCLIRSSGLWSLVPGLWSVVTVSISRLGVAAPAWSRGGRRGAVLTGVRLGVGTRLPMRRRRRRRRFLPRMLESEHVPPRPRDPAGLGRSGLVCLRQIGPSCVSPSRIPRSNVAPEPTHTHAHTTPRRCVTDGGWMGACLVCLPRAPLKRRVE